MQQPDNFFKDKLEHYQRPAPIDAWDRIDANLNKRNRKGLWLKIAASLTLFALIGYYLTPTRHAEIAIRVEQDSSINKPLTNIKKTDVALSQPKKDDDVTMSVEKLKKKAATVKEQHIARITPDTKPKVDQIEEVVNENNIAETFTETSVDTVASYEAIATTNTLPVSQDVMNNDHSTTLVYTAAEVDKYLIKKDNGDATSGEEKQSTFKKLLTKAYLLKNDQDALGGLRQKKNEILALDFRKEKRGQNK